VCMRDVDFWLCSQRPCHRHKSTSRLCPGPRATSHPNAEPPAQHHAEVGGAIAKSAQSRVPLSITRMSAGILDARASGSCSYDPISPQIAMCGRANFRKRLRICASCTPDRRVVAASQKIHRGPSPPLQRHCPRRRLRRKSRPPPPPRWSSPWLLPGGRPAQPRRRRSLQPRRQKRRRLWAPHLRRRRRLKTGRHSRQRGDRCDLHLWCR
jgi:hypothetical protein